MVGFSDERMTRQKTWRATDCYFHLAGVLEMYIEVGATVGHTLGGAVEVECMQSLHFI